jgi:hypothetical protein
MNQHSEGTAEATSGNGKGSTDGGVYFTDVFGVDEDTLDDYGAFNISLVNDLPLFIDPFLLFTSEKDEYQALHESIIKYLRFLRVKSVLGMVTPGLLAAWFMFREVKQNWLGFSMVGNAGSGLGLDFATSLHRNLGTVFRSFGEETVTRASHLEKLCLIRDGVGRDNISDFTTTLIKEFLLRYTETFAREHIDASMRRTVSVEKVRFNYETESWERRSFELPYFNGDYVMLTPKDILTKEDIWINRPELLRTLDEIAAALPNETLRAQINNHLYRQLSREREATQKELREARARTLEEFPVLIEHYIRAKEDTGDEAESVSSQRVRQAEWLYVEEVRELRSHLALHTKFYENPGTTYDEALERALFLKDIIENKDGYRIFYSREGVLITREEHLQILYRLTWFRSPSDVNREVNNGRGPVDFKISRGAADKTLIEFKLASNKQLKRNLEKQVEIYQRASDAPRAVKVITFFTAAEEERVYKILNELCLVGMENIVLIDARRDNKPSASVA